MRTSFIMANLAALAGLIMTGNFSPSYAASCEAALKPQYSCTATFEGGGSVNYCLTADAGISGDGKFLLIADGTYFANCTCEAGGSQSNPQFGTSRDFFCSENVTHTTSIGKVMGNKIKGQIHNTSAAIRSVFTCEAVPLCF